MCMDSQEIEETDRPIIAFNCHGQGGNQYFLFSKNNEIRREEKCLDYAGGRDGLKKSARIMSVPCHSMKGNQMWFYEVS